MKACRRVDDKAAAWYRANKSRDRRTQEVIIVQTAP
jgi:hypothetical protein